MYWPKVDLPDFLLTAWNSRTCQMVLEIARSSFFGLALGSWLLGSTSFLLWQKGPTGKSSAPAQSPRSKALCSLTTSSSTVRHSLDTLSCDDWLLTYGIFSDQ